MTGNNRGAADGAISPDVGAAGYDSTPGDNGSRADAGVMTDVYQVIQFDAILDDGVLLGAAVDGGICANFYIVTNLHAPQLWHFAPAFGAGGEAKAVGANDNACVEYGAGTQIGRAHGLNSSHVASSYAVFCLI